MSISRKHYEALAVAIRDADMSPSARLALTCEIATILKQANPSFNRERFIAAVGAGS